MAEVGILEAKTQFSALVAKAERGEETVITRHGKPVARLSAVTAAVSRPPRRYSGEELLARSLALRERIAREDPELDTMSWEEMKVLARGG